MAVHPPSSALVRPGDHGPVVVLAGAIDMEAVSDVRVSIGEALARGADPLVFDLREVSFLDSSGLSVLLSAALRAEVVLRSVPARVHALLEMSDVVGRFRLED
jgi:anti-sigma B factor antagonist